MDFSQCYLILPRRRWHHIGNVIGDIKLLFYYLHINIEEWNDS